MVSWELAHDTRGDLRADLTPSPGRIFK